MKRQPGVDKATNNKSTLADRLSELPNGEDFERAVKEAIVRLEPFAIGLVTIDNFHGDNCDVAHHKELAKVIISWCRPDDQAYLYDEKRWAIIMPRTRLLIAANNLETLRASAAIQNLTASESSPITLSIGVADVSFDELRLDAATVQSLLYTEVQTAQFEGGNCTCWSQT